ncbi:zinc finger protein 845 isoform X2 [Agrilus planipennis]|nr:zinc finger protein 845 isoform X2 [Agrilus planipennis]
MDDNYEDDAHYCLKCHSTIIGLDNYVNHRKLLCNKTTPQLLSADEGPITLKADDFFSSLELQSSSKKVSHTATNSKTSGIFTRSKTLAALHGNNASTKDCSTSPTLQKNNTENNSWVEESKEREKKNIVNKDCDTDESDGESVDLVCEDDDSDEDDEEEEYANVPPKSFTGGKWKPRSPIQWYGVQNQNDDREWNPPPPNYTGGKWKPVHYFSNKPKSPSPSSTDYKRPNHPEPPPPNYTKGKWKPPVLPRNKEYQEDEKWDPSVPPPSHTKGKWKPTVEVKSSAPPPSHTRGKWKPRDREELCTAVNKKIEGRPFVKSNGRIHYWCGPCNRRLSSKIVYNRHLKSELHLKRTNDGDLEVLPRVKEKQKLTKINNKVSPVPEKAVKKELSEKQRKRKKLYKHCDVCKSRVNMKSIGKHLISHYHCRRGDPVAPETQQLILDNIHNIVLQCPFQCAPCKFYCNTQETFLKHWTSLSHKTKNHSTNGYFNCGCCKFSCIESDEMHQHLIGQEHLEVISVINGSVPIVIKRLSPISCVTCGEEFLLNIQLRKHCERLGHSFANTASDTYQSKYKCSSCNGTFKSAIALQRHMLSAHNTSTFICGTCSVTFNDIEEAKNHRRTWEHRQKVLEKRQKQTKDGSDRKECHFCSKVFSSFSEMKEHQKVEHPDIKHSCPYCGKSFTIPQDLTVHIRTKACSFTDTEDKEHTCKQCPFKTDSMSDFLFHNALHTEPLILYPEEEHSQQAHKKPIEQYKCPVCEKFYPKSSLLGHLRLHTSERPYACKICRASFARKNNLLYHMKKHTKKDMAGDLKEKTGDGEKSRLHLCSACGASFRKRSILQQHMTRHTGKLYRCPRENCVFSARTPGELKPHLVTHEEKKPFSCELCDYKGKTKQQLLRHLTLHDSHKKFHCSQCSFSTRFASHLRRHLRLHTGAKPFTCPHCEYKCNTLENLRRHILSTTKHAGKYIYECRFCNIFQTNFAKDYKVHLVSAHSDKFVSTNEAITYIAGIYQSENDTSSFHVVLDDPKGQGSAEKESLQESTQSVSQQTCGTNDLGPAILLTSVSGQDANEHKIQDELFSMFIVSKDVVRVENMTESWIMEENYDVEEAGVLIPFQSEGDSLFNEHF